MRSSRHVPPLQTAGCRLRLFLPTEDKLSEGDFVFWPVHRASPNTEPGKCSVNTRLKRHFYSFATRRTAWYGDSGHEARQGSRREGSWGAVEQYKKGPEPQGKRGRGPRGAQCSDAMRTLRGEQMQSGLSREMVPEAATAGLGETGCPPSVLFPRAAWPRGTPCDDGCSVSPTMAVTNHVWHWARAVWPA